MKTILLLSVLLISGLGSAYAISPLVLEQATFKGGFVNMSCGDHPCLPNENQHFWFSYINSALHSKASQKFTVSNTPMSLNIIAPDGTCNITGTLNPDGSCSTPSMVISAADFATLQTNPAIMSVPANTLQPTQATPTTTYCQIANWIIMNEDGYTQYVANETALIDPAYCQTEPVPEFGSFAGITLLVAITSIIILASRTHLKL